RRRPAARRRAPRRRHRHPARHDLPRSAPRRTPQPPSRTTPDLAVMGKTHALSGLAVGLVVGPAVGVHQPIDLAVFAGTTAGFAVFPDIDHPKSSATRKLGIAGRAACKVMRGVSRVVYKATRGRNDRRGGGVHRHLSHTVLFAL